MEPPCSFLKIQKRDDIFWNWAEWWRIFLPPQAFFTSPTLDKWSRAQASHMKSGNLTFLFCTWNLKISFLFHYKIVLIRKNTLTLEYILKKYNTSWFHKCLLVRWFVQWWEDIYCLSATWIYSFRLCLVYIDSNQWLISAH